MSKGRLEIPEEIREFVEKSHKDIRESRPDEGWRIQPMQQADSIAPYKRDEEEMDAEKDETPGFAQGGTVPGYDDGGAIPDSNADLADIAKMGGMMPGSPLPAAAPAAPMAPPVAAPPPMAPPNPAMPATSAAPAPTDQDFMDRANKMLGLNPTEQAGFMKMLGGNAQKAQLGAGVAGIGDAIASGGTLGKVNPGALNRSEDIIQGKEKAGIEGMQTIRGNQEKAQELSDKLEARDPNSPLSRWAQKAYGPIGKKIGLNLNNASAALIGDVSGKGVEALKADYEQQLKTMGLGLQKEQIEATKSNQQAERRQADATRKAAAVKELADQGVTKKIDNFFTPSGRAAQKELEKEASGAASYAPDVLAYADRHGITPDQAQVQKDRRMGGK